MFDIGWSELLIIGIVALIVVGPKDLPGMFRTLGRFTGKMRGMAREFQRAMNQAADESGVKDISKEIKSAASPKKFGLDTVRSAAREFQDGLVTGDNSPSKSKSGPTKASATSGKKKSDADSVENKDIGSKSASSSAESPPAAPQAHTDGSPNGNSSALEKPPSNSAMNPSAEAKTQGKPSVSKSNAGATYSEFDEEARRAESDS